MNIAPRIDHKIFHIVGGIADEMNRPCYAVGGYVRDLFLNRHSKDIDFVTVGSGIDVARSVAAALGRGAKCNVFRTFGTAQVRHHTLELEFVGARRESYSHDSRKPIVEDGTLDDDLARRDFTINAMAVCVNTPGFGDLIDPYDGLGDLDRQIIRTPLDPDITFSDDPLRMMRAIRFATQLGFTIADDTFEAIARNAGRLPIISRERIADELMKIMASPVPSIGWILLDRSGLLEIVLPELHAMKGVDTVNGRGHKDNFYHTLAVLDNVARCSDNVWLRWAALLHDIAKPVTKRWDHKLGWTFHNHNFIGSKMVPRIFRDLRLPLNEKMKYVQKLVELHMRPQSLVEEGVTDSAVRRLRHEADDDLEDLMTLCEADITSRNEEKVRRFLDNFAIVREKVKIVDEKDAIRRVRPPFDGHEIQRLFGIGPSPAVGVIYNALLEAVLSDRVAQGDRKAAYPVMLEVAASIGLTPVDGVTLDM